MAKKLFVKFDPLSALVGSRNTGFGKAETATLVLANGLLRERDEEAVYAPMIPETREELVAFAAIMGWKTGHDANGRIVFHPELSPGFDENE